MTLLVTLDARTCLVPIGVFPGRYWTHLGQPRLLRVHWPKTNIFCPNNSKVCISQGRRDLSFSLLSIVLQWFSQHENLKKMAFWCDHKQPMRNSDFHGRTNLSVVCFGGLERRCFYLWAASKLWQQKLFSGRVTMKLISVTAIGAFQLATKGGYQRVIRKKHNKAEFRDISWLFLDISELVLFLT